MAQEPSGPPAKAPWTKIFTAFKVALDMKKLVLAAAGIFLVALGWWAISWTFYSMRSFPEWKNFEDKERQEPEQRKAQWNHFKAKRLSWNLLHELAGDPSDHQKENAADVAKDLDEYLLLQKWDDAHQRLYKPIVVKEKTLVVPDINKDAKFTLSPGDKDAETELPKLNERQLTVRSLEFPEAKDEKASKLIKIDGIVLQVDGPTYDKLKEYFLGAKNPVQIAQEARQETNQKVAQQALLTFNTHLVNAKYKPSGKLRICPWSEYRGPNPYLVVANTLKSSDAVGSGGRVLNWVFSERVLVLLEPLVKFLMPLVYLFDARAGGWDRLYLIFIILWTLAIWGFFGGAICRIAAVQVARNERISLREAIVFTRERFASYVAAPVFPLVLLGVFVVVLMLFGWLEWIPYFGDVFAGLFWPIVLLIGFTMTIVLVGLIGWPLMIATISTEGTDSFDALSRSYSYVYQAPWQYLWYNFLALVYGAVLVFFIGFMASLMVFLGKWGVSSAVGLSNPNPANDREPSYLFYYAPESYGWRELLISSNTPFVETKKGIAPDGKEVNRLDFKPEYENHLTGFNKFGAFLVACWIYPFFLLVLGFGYSYFWTSSTIIYFLMRRCVDDTEMDEVHQDDEDLDDPFLKSAPTAPVPAPAAPPAKPGMLSLNVVEAPPPPTTFSADHAEKPPAPSETSSPPAQSPPPDGHT
jgi:hypothetical protein